MANAKINLKKAFEEYYNEQKKLEGPTVSGAAATLDSTINIRKSLPFICETLSTKSICDIGCGDLHWLNNVELNNITYTGYDIVPNIIKQITLAHNAPNRKFILADALTAKLPQSDLVLCRDVITHLSLFDGRRLLQNIKKSGSHYLLASTKHDRHDANGDSPAPAWKPVNMMKAPFMLSSPLFLIPGNHPHHDMGLWKIDEIKIHTPDNIKEIASVPPRYDDFDQFSKSNEYKDYMKEATDE